MREQQSITSQQTDIPVFWTGGVDSTARILELILYYGCTVQPIYARLKARQSIDLELAAMQRIRSGFETAFPNWAERLLPTIMIDPTEITMPTWMEEAGAKIAAATFVPSQYKWLAALVDSHQFGKIELGWTNMVEDNSRMSVFVRERLQPAVYPCGAPHQVLPAWTPQNDFEDGMRIFQMFNFPQPSTTTAENYARAEERGYAHLLQLCWICRMPVGNQPCGMCLVCRAAITDGKTRLFPRSALLRNRVWFIVHPLRVLIRSPKRTLMGLRRRLAGTR